MVRAPAWGRSWFKSWPDRGKGFITVVLWLPSRTPGAVGAIPGCVSILSSGAQASLIGSFCRCEAARSIIKIDPSLKYRLRIASVVNNQKFKEKITRKTVKHAMQCPMQNVHTIKLMKCACTISFQKPCQFNVLGFLFALKRIPKDLFTDLFRWR